ncbi:MAG: S8 family serine peptidase, partial [Acidobacteriota bacterium]|nr:S8 family serine peptidase [Acidobacteriota bacterium]
MRRPHFAFSRSTRSGWIQFVSFLLCYALLSPCFAGLRSATSARVASKKEVVVQQQGSRDGELLVKFREGASENEKNNVALAHGSRRRKKLRGESALEKMDVPAGQSAETFARLLASNPAIEFAEPNFLIKHDQLQTENSESIPALTAAWLPKTSASVFPSRFDKQYVGTAAINGGLPSGASAGKFLAPQSGLEANDPRFNEQWALRNTGQNGGQFGSDINITRAWERTTGSVWTVIAVIDSGIDFTHPDLSDNEWTNTAPGTDGDLHGWDYVADSAVIKDEQGHGTAIGGIIAAQGNNATGISGVMWRASLMSLRVLDNTGTGDIANAVEAIDYAVTHGAQVINISWGTTGESLALKDAIERAIRRGVVVVCSAGNSGQNVDTVPYYPASFGSRDLITVAGTDNFDQLASWSNWGRKNVSVAAPGANILTTRMGGGYWNVNGTSASAPFVAGVAGLIKSLRPQMNTHNVVKAITDHARQVASLSSRVAAAGVVNAAAALDTVHGSANPGPPVRPPTPGHGSGGTGPGGTFSTTPPPRSTGAPGLNLPNLDQVRRAQSTRPAPQAPIQSNLLCADCDPYNGGGGGSYYPSGDPNFSGPRRRPINETGQPGVDLGSRNFNWSLPLVSLAGRAGLDLNLSLFYNSLVWTKDGNYIKYNADLGTPAPGFRIGLPTLQQRFYNSQTGVYAYLMVTSSGARVEMRQVGSSNIYESQDGSYTQLDASNPNALLVRTTDGTQLSFIPVTINNEFRCIQIKDRN